MIRAQTPLWLACLALATPLAVTGRAAALDSTTTATSLAVTLLKIGDKTYNSAAMRPLNKAECADKSLRLSFRVEGLAGTTSNPNYLEVWVGTDCDNDKRKDATDNEACTRLTSYETETTDKTLADFEVPVTKLCDTEGSPTLYFLGVQNKNSSELPSYVGTVNVNVDQSAPGAPTKVNGGSGETEIPIKWKSPAGDVDHYLLIWDEGASSAPSSKDAGASDDDGGVLLAGPSDCSSSLLIGGSDLGGDLDELPSGLDGKRINGKVESTTIDGTNLNSDLAAVAIIAVDLAGNASPVSNVSCIDVVPTTGFWDQYQMDGNAVDAGCACSTPGGAGGAAPRGRAAWPAVALLFGAALLRARRRRS